MRPFQVAHVGSAEVHPLHRLGGASQRRIVEMASRQAQLGYEVAVYAAGQEIWRSNSAASNCARCAA